MLNEGSRSSCEGQISTQPVPDRLAFAVRGYLISNYCLKG